jgi:hypothetical protein
MTSSSICVCVRVQSINNNTTETIYPSNAFAICNVTYYLGHNLTKSTVVKNDHGVDC